LEKVDATYYRIKNRWKSDQYLHMQDPVLTLGPIQPGWSSAMWALEGFKGNANNANDPNQDKVRHGSTLMEFGAIPTTPETMAFVKKANNVNAAAASYNLNNAPAYFTLDMPPIGQQGNEGSCAAWACGYALKSFEMKKSKGVPYLYLGTNVTNLAAVASPEYLFNRINVDNTNCAKGAYLVADWPDRGALNVLKTEGIVSWQEVPYSDVNGCGTVANDKETASPNAAENRITNYTRITDLSTTSLKTLLLDQHPIVIMVFCSDDFMTAGPGFVWRSGEGPSKRAHAMTIIGYDDTKKAYRVQNSWGNDWGDKGYAWIDYEFAKTLIKEAYVSYAQNLNQFDITSPGFVTVYSEAGYVAWCKLSYTLPGGEKKVIEENLSLFFVFKKLIPPGSTDVTLEVGGYGVIDPLNIKQDWPNSNVQACFKIWGTIFDTQYGVVDCAY
jgi:C1A family cysteine protease